MYKRINVHRESLSAEKAIGKFIKVLKVLSLNISILHHQQLLNKLMHNSCILTSSEAVTFAWIKKYLHSMKNQLKIDLYLLKIDNEINFVMEQTSVIAEKMSFFKDTYCKVESREVHF